AVVNKTVSRSTPRQRDQQPDFSHSLLTRHCSLALATQAGSANIRVLFLLLLPLHLRAFFSFHGRNSHCPDLDSITPFSAPVIRCSGALSGPGCTRVSGEHLSPALPFTRQQRPLIYHHSLL